MDRKNKNLYYLKVFMSSVNFIILVFLSAIVLKTTVNIKDQSMARNFLENIPHIPREPVQSTIIVFIAFFSLLVIIEARKKIYTKHWLSVLVYLLEIFLCLTIIQYMYISYNGIILLVIADIVTSIKEKYNRLTFLVVMSVIYIFADYNLVSGQIPMISLQEYLDIYPSGISTFLMGIKNVLAAVNIIAFVMYMIILMQNQMKENARIELLNLQLRTANEKLKDMNAQLKDYAVMQEKMGEAKERNRVAREIHDTLGHTMTGLSAGIDACIAMIDHSVEQTKKQLSVISEVARQGIKDIRRSVNKLRPDALEHLTLEDALFKMIQDTMAVSNVNISLISSVEKLKFNSDEEDIIYRVVQEGITNAVRHGAATKISIYITKKEKWLTLLIQDNGKGCEKIETGFGLIHIEERIGLLHGTVAYDGSDGFTITAKIPIRWGENYD